mmetsp:Transcript_8849/g.15012  ORF Transcript_8849/g.15012 Transcript_8849/m.15012 type:complete len:102 (+) Transcript_8849:2815-3120(+)
MMEYARCDSHYLLAIYTYLRAALALQPQCVIKRHSKKANFPPENVLSILQQMKTGQTGQTGAGGPGQAVAGDFVQVMKDFALKKMVFKNLNKTLDIEVIAN